MNTNGARDLVMSFASSPDVVSDMRDLVGDLWYERGLVPIDEQLTALKIAEYALLLGPIVGGVEDLVRDWDELFDRNYSCGDVEEIVNDVGTASFERIDKRISDEEEREDLICEIAETRYKLLGDKYNDFRGMVCPFDNTLLAASTNAVSSAIDAASACALALQSDSTVDMSDLEQVDVVKHSPQLYLSLPMVHIRDVPTSMDVLGSHNLAVRNGVIASKLVKFDPTKGKVVLDKGVPDWTCPAYGPGTQDGPISQRDSNSVDVRIGCPFTFAPKSLRLTYYRNIVDLLQRTGFWPQRVSLTSAPKE